MPDAVEAKERQEEEEEVEETVNIHIMGKEYEVPKGLTIMDAIEYSGYQLIRGVGCRGGFCGACATLYRLENDYKLYADLACQKTVEDGMYLMQLPFTPAGRKTYDLEEVSNDGNPLLEHYPEIARCVSCNTCTKACPQDLEVMDFINEAIRGDIEEVVNLSFDCIQCGICAARCPAEIPHHHVAQMARRVYAKDNLPESDHVAKRVEEIEAGEFAEELEEISSLPREELEDKYESREIE